ncbi:peroxidase 64 [Tanacetum coccineum]
MGNNRIIRGTSARYRPDKMLEFSLTRGRRILPTYEKSGYGDVIRCGQICKDLSLQVNDLKIIQDFHPFSLGGADLVLGIQCQDMEHHVLHLEQTLKLLHDIHFFVKLSKCCFGQTKVLFLGHVVTSEGVQVEQEKLSAVKSWPIHSNVKQKDGFIWSKEALLAFNTLKHALLTAPVLRLPDFSKTFVVEYDASSEGVGAILSQDEHPVAYFSKVFSLSNRVKSAYDHHYTLKFLLEQRITSTEQQQLLFKLMPYDFSIHHRAGKENRGADALSRMPHSGELLTLTIPYCVEVADISGLQTDPFTSDIIQRLLSDPTAVPDFHLVEQFLFYKNRLVILEVSSIKLKLLQEAHTTPLGGHGGFLKTIKRLNAQYFWPKMKQEVRLFVQQCVVCQQQKYQTLSPAGLLQPLPIPTQIWEDISMDFIVGLPPSNRFDTILVVVDRLSKYAHFICLSHPFTAKSVASVFCKEIVRLHGFPRSIVSDRDVIFLSNFWQELFRLSQTKLQLSTSYHPQTDGQTEVLNRCLEAYLRCFAAEQPTKWSSYLPWAEFSYNTGYHTSTGTTPFSVVYGREPPPLFPYVSGETKNNELEQQLITRDDMIKLIRLNLSRAQDRMRNQANSQRRELSFQVGDYVFLKIQPYRQRSLAKRRYEKLSPRFFGPYHVKRIVGPVAYELQLPSDARIHHVFHVSMLKPAHSSFDDTAINPLPLLISWSNRPVEEATWESYDLLKEQFPNFRLEDKSFYREGSNDTTGLQVYGRQKGSMATLSEEVKVFVVTKLQRQLDQLCKFADGGAKMQPMYSCLYAEADTFMDNMMDHVRIHCDKKTIRSNVHYHELATPSQLFP